MSNPIRWGILGTGFAAQQFAKGLEFVHDAQLVGVASRSMSRAQDFASRNGDCHPYGHYEELLNQKDIDVIYIATTSNRHKDDCVQSLNAGKPVLCEKPFSINAAEARTVVAVAREKGLFCMEAMWMRFQPLIQRTRELIQAGAIGEIRLVTADFGVPTEFEPDSRYFNPQLGGGALLDRGVYCLSLASLLLGKPDGITSQATISATGVDEQSSMLLHYAEGQQAVLSSSLTAYTSNQAWIIGTTGRIVIHEPFYRPHRISILRKPPYIHSHDISGLAAKQGVKQKLVAGVANSEIKVVRHLYYRLRDRLAPLAKQSSDLLMPPCGNGYNYEAAEVMRCLRSGALESPLMPLDESVQIMETIDKIRAQWPIQSTVATL